MQAFVINVAIAYFCFLFFDKLFTHAQYQYVITNSWMAETGRDAKFGRGKPIIQYLIILCALNKSSVVHSAVSVFAQTSSQIFDEIIHQAFKFYLQLTFVLSVKLTQ